MSQPSDYALLSAAAYGDARLSPENDAPVRLGWTELTGYAESGSGVVAGLSGFSARVYKSSGGEIVISYAGTQFGGSASGQFGDWAAGNGPLAFGLYANQAQKAAELYQLVASREGNNITFTGHSLGGGLAAMMAVFFNRPAKVFAPAPFRSSVDATQYVTGALGPLAAIRASLFLRGQLDPSLGGIPQELADYSPATDYVLRSGNVAVWAVKGEVLEAVLPSLGFPMIENSGSRVSLIAAGTTDLGMLPKHSIDLHAAALLSPTFNEWASKIPSLLPLMFDNKLYISNLITGDKQDYLVKLVRNEVGTPQVPKNGMLTHFANDLQKLGTNLAGLNKAAQDALIAQGIEWYYWQGTDYAGQEFFTQTGELLQYTTANGAGLADAQNKSASYIAAWLTPIANTHGEFYFPAFGTAYDQWNVSAGSAGVTATAKDATKSQIYIGQGGADTFTGGNLSDVIFAGAGNDILDGGTGSDKLYGGAGTDTYSFTGAWGTDQIIDADSLGQIKIDSDTLSGGKSVSKGIWVSQDNKYGFAKVDKGGGKTDLVIVRAGSADNVVTIKDFKAGDLGLNLEGFEAGGVEVTQVTAGKLQISAVFNPLYQPFPSVGLAGPSYHRYNTQWSASYGYQNLIETGGFVAAHSTPSAITGTRFDDDIEGSDGVNTVMGGGGRDQIRTLGGDDLVLVGAGELDYSPDSIFNGALPVDKNTSLDFEGYDRSYLLTWAQASVLQPLLAGLPYEGLKAFYGDLGSDARLGDSRFSTANHLNENLDGPADPASVTRLRNFFTAGAVVDGGTGADRLYGSIGADMLYGGDGDYADQLYGGYGSDTLNGGEGDDFLTGDGRIFLDVDGSQHGQDLLLGGAGADTLIGGGNSDVLEGGADDDMLFGDVDFRSANVQQSLYGQNIALNQRGDDYLDGGAGNDYLLGDAGSDILLGGSGNDDLFGDDLAYAGSTYTISGDAHGKDTLDGGEGDDQIIGGGNDDVLLGGSGNDKLYGDGAQDSMYSEDSLAAQYHGNDYLDGGDGVDQLVGGGGDDVLVGGAGNDNLVAGSGNDSLDGGHDDDQLIGGSGDDVLLGGDGNDSLFGDDGDDTMSGGTGNDFYVVGNTADIVIELEGEGSDYIESSVSFKLPENVEGMRVSGAGAIDLTGNAQNNGLYGNAGANILVGGAGDDFLKGGAGDDVYTFNRGDGADAIDNVDVFQDTSNPLIIGATDTLKFGSSIAAADVVGSRTGDDLFLWLRNTGDRVGIAGYFSAPESTTNSGSVVFDRKIDKVEFANGVVWDQAMIETVVARQISNRAPVISESVPTLRANAGDVFTYIIAETTIVDPDSWDVITYSVTMPDGSALPSWLSFNAATRTLTGVATTAEIGSLELMVSGTDSYGAAVSLPVDLNIGRANQSPVVNAPLPDQTAVQGLALNFTLPSNAFTDADAGDALQLTAQLADGTALPSGLVFDAQTRRFTGSLSATGTVSVRVTATDGNGLNASDIFDIVVRARNTVGTAGRDTLEGGAGADLLQGLAGDDILLGGDGDDILEGGDGFDTLYGENGNDILIGGAGGDSLYGGDGNDFLSTGEVMNGGLGLDTYKVFDISSQISSYVDKSVITAGNDGGDIVLVGGGLNPADVFVTRSGARDLILTSRSSGAVVTLVNAIVATGSTAPFNEVRFESVPTVVWTISQLREMAIQGNVQNNEVAGYMDVNNVLNGAAGDDRLFGGNLSDTVDGGSGNDYLAGGAGNDTYLFGAESGADQIVDFGANSANIIRLGAGVNITSLRLIRTSNTGEGTTPGNDSLVLLAGPNGARLWIDQFFQPNGSSFISEIQFTDGSGTVLRYADIVALAGAAVVANQNAQTGTAGDDFFDVDHVLDTIIEIAGGGIDTVRSTVSYTLPWSYTSPSQVENLELVGPLAANGTGNELNNILRGNEGHNVLRGAGGVDQYYGGRGDDTFIHSAVKYFYTDEIFRSETPTIYENANEGYDTLITDAFSIRLPDNVERLLVPTLMNVSSINYPAGQPPVHTYLGNGLDNVIDLSGPNFRHFSNVLSVRIDGGAGGDLMIGGFGRNTYVVDNAGDVIVELQRAGGKVESSVTYALGDSLSDLSLTGDSVIDGYGNQLDNILNGRLNSQGNVLSGFAGNDTYHLGLGDTVVEAADGGNDRVVLMQLDTSALTTVNISDWANIESLQLGGRLGNINVAGSAFSDTLTGSLGSNTIEGFDGDDVISNVYEGDIPYSITLNDYRTYSSATDNLFGGNGNDTLYSYGGFGSVDGGTGNDSIVLFNTTYVTVDGGTGNDRIQSNQVVFDLLFGVGSGNDRVTASGARSPDSWLANQWLESTISLGNGTDASNLRFVKTGTGLVVSLIGGNDSITISDFFDAAGTAVVSNLDSIRLADGTILNRDAIVAGLARTDLQAGTSANDLLIATVANQVLVGAQGNDQMFGQSGNDTLDGGVGDDRLHGGAGNDLLIGGAGNDFLIGGQGADSYNFSLGWGTDVVDDLQSTVWNSYTSNRRLLEDGAVDVINFDAAILVSDISATMVNSDLLLTHRTSGDTVTVKTYFDSALGRIESIRFADGTIWNQSRVESLVRTISGTEGADTLYGASGVNGGSSDLFGLGGNDTLFSYGAPDNLYGGSGDDILNGAGGADLLDGGLGNDQMNGGTGSDQYVVDSALDIVFESEGYDSGNDTVSASINYVLAANVENLVLVGTSGLSGTGNVLANVLTGNAVANVLDGAAGIDTLIGSLGDDTYVVDNIGDVVVEKLDEGLDAVQSSVTFTLSEHVENVTLTGTAAIRATGNALGNVLAGNSGANVLTGGAGNDTYVVSVGDSTIEVAGGGIDTVESAVTWTLATELENLTLTGAAAINATGNVLGNILNGNSAANTLSGLAGDDQYRISLGGGADRVVETTGNDRIVFGAGIAAGQVTATRAAGVVKLAISGSDSVSFDELSNGVFALEQFEFSNGTVLGAAWVNSLFPNAAPSATNLSAAEAYVEDTACNLVNIVVSDADSVNTSVTLTLSNAAAGSLNTGVSSTVTSSYSPVSGVWSASGAMADVNSLLASLTFMPSANFNGAFSIETSVSDGFSPAVIGVKNFTGTAVNDAPTGSVVITGTATQSQTLTASNTLADLDGLGAITYQWRADGVAIAGATGSTLMLGASQVGKAISVVAAYTDAQGTVESRASTATAAVIGGFVGTAGADTLSGTAGADQLMGLAGDDIYVVSNAGDNIIENLNEGIDTVQSSLTYTLAANVENLTLTGSTAINGTGNILNNLLVGNTANNTLTGGVGDDSLDGKAGTDTLIGGVGNDTYYVDVAADVVTELANEGTDTVNANFTYALNADVENLILTGTAAINGTGNSLNNTLTGNSAINTLDGGAGADTLIGGAGNDIYVVDNAGDVATENLSEGTDLVNASVSYILAANVENLTLTGTTAINGTGNALNNTLTGNSGNNALDGGAGADLLVGGTGNDTYYVDNAADVTTEAASAGTDTVISSVNWTLATNLENLTLSGAANINATGNTVANVLTGNAGDNVLNGGAGADTMVGGLGNDTYVVDVTADVITEAASAGTDLVQSAITYTLGNTLENLTLTGTAAINATGNALDNLLTGNSGINVLTGGAGNDTYVVGTGDTTGEAANAGTDTVQSSISWTLANNVENLTLTGIAAISGTGNAANNILLGNSGVNILTGNAGNDYLNGGAGADSLIGGTGNDTYWLGRGYGLDTITENDATAGNTDIARFDTGISKDQLWFAKSGNNLDVSIIGTSDKFTVTNWYLGNQYHVEQFKTSDGKTLLDSQVQNLVSAMAAFAPPAAGQTTLTAAYAASLAPVLAANWQ